MSYICCTSSRLNTRTRCCRSRQRRPQEQPPCARSSPASSPPSTVSSRHPRSGTSPTSTRRWVPSSDRSDARHAAARSQDLRHLRRHVAGPRGRRRRRRPARRLRSATPARSSCPANSSNSPGGTPSNCTATSSTPSIALKAEAGGDIAISGSVSIVRQLLDAGLIDELHLLVDPIAVRDGCPAVRHDRRHAALDARQLGEPEQRRPPPRLRPGRGRRPTAPIVTPPRRWPRPATTTDRANRRNIVMADHGVVIAGGGPTGMMLAGELALAGADVVIVERRTSRELDGSRAGGLYARTIEVLDQRGIADRFLAEGQAMQVQGFAYIPLDISDFPTRHNYGLALWQTPLRAHPRRLDRRARRADPQRVATWPASPRTTPASTSSSPTARRYEPRTSSVATADAAPSARQPASSSPASIRRSAS